MRPSGDPTISPGTKLGIIVCHIFLTWGIFLCVSGPLNMPGSPQNLLLTTLCDIISESLVLIFAFVTSVNCMNKNVY